MGQEKKKSADREEKIFTSTVYNLIYKYILGINQKNKTNLLQFNHTTATQILKCQSDY